MAAVALTVGSIFLGAGGGGFGNGAFSPWAFGYGLLSLAFAPKQTIKGPRQKDRNPPDSRLGEAISKGFGIYPVTGDIVWSEKIVEEEETEEQGGKGGGQEVTTYHYSVSATWMLGQGPIKRLRRLRLNDKLIYDYNGGDEKGRKGFLGKRPEGQKEYFTYDAEESLFVSPNGKVRIRCGTEKQMPDTLEESHRGVDRAVAYRGNVTITFEELDLDDFGGRHPIVNALLESPQKSYASIAQWICKEAGLQDGDIDFCEIAAENCTGFIIDERREAKQWMEQVAILTQCDFPERDAGEGIKIIAFKRGRPAIATITDDDLLARDYGNEMPNDDWKRGKEWSIPGEVEVSGLDASREYTGNYGRAWMEVDGASKQKAQVATSAVLTQPQMRRLAEIELYRRRVERLGRDIHLPPKWAWLSSGDPVTLQDEDGNEQTVILAQSQESLFGILTYNTAGYDPQVYDYPLLDAVSDDEIGTIDDGEGHVYAILDVNSVKDTDNTSPCLLLAATAQAGAEWGTIAVSSSAFEPEESGDVESGGVVRIKSRATMGSTLNALGDFNINDSELGGTSAIFDDVNTLTVDLDYGSLTSVTDDQLYQGKNAAVVGLEGIQFGKATYIGTFSNKKRYELSHLLRGRRGTEFFIGTHEADEAFVFLNDAVKFAKYRRGYLNTAIELRAVVSKEDVLSAEFTPVGRNLWPYSPHYVAGTRDGSNNLAITWKRRSRYTGSAQWKTGVSPIVGEESEVYSIDILDGSGNVVRTLPDVYTPTATYTAAQQTTDFGSPQSSVTVKIYQISAVTGRGYPATVTI